MATLADQLPPPALKTHTIVRRYADGRRIEIKVVLQLLTKRQVQQAAAGALERLRALSDEDIGSRTREAVLKDLEDIEILAMACRKADSKTPERPEPWLSAMELEAIVPTIELDNLADAYMQHANEQSSLSDTIDHDTYEATLSALADGDESIWSHMTATARTRVAETMAKELVGRRLLEPTAEALSLDGWDAT